MELSVNGVVRELPDGITIPELLLLQAGRTDGVAVAVDGDIVHRPDWAGYELRNGQEIELVAALQGG
jgi:sulfur carrier protein